MYRSAQIFLNRWFESTNRKPLILRGVRQVGKTWLVRQLAEENNLNLIELNFEKRAKLSTFFELNDPKKILLRISSSLGGQHIDPRKSLLFLDEVQEFPELLSKLRWFAEDMPELPVIAAGSLLEFALEKYSMSMPVGRVSYMYLEPLSFEEFLLANDNKSLVDYLKSYTWDEQIPLVMHEDLMGLFKEYLIVGGMPAAVSSWIQYRSLQDIHAVHNDLMTSYRDDFHYYRGKIDIEALDDVLLAIPKKLGEKFVYSKVDPLVKANIIKKALELLCKACICHKVKGTGANGVPLGAEAQEAYLKMIYLDVGLASSVLRFSLNQIMNVQEIELINSGGIAEQVVGQLLRTVDPVYIDPALYYWHREKGGSAEIDYIIQHHNKVIPIEVKAGSTGGLKSLHVFMSLKNLQLAVRVNSARPSKTDVAVKDYQGNSINYKLLSIPFYMIGQIHRLLEKE